MKKIPNPPIANPAGGALREAVRFLVRGIIAGVVFQGMFLMLSFQNRIIRSVTSKRLEEIKQLQDETADRIRRGEKPLIDFQLLRDQYIDKLKQTKLAPQ